MAVPGVFGPMKKTDKRIRLVDFDWQAICRALLRSADIREGRWRVALRFTQRAMNINEAGPNGEARWYPTAMNLAQGAQLTRLGDEEELDPLSIDAAQLWLDDQGPEVAGAASDAVLVTGPTDAQ